MNSAIQNIIYQLEDIQYGKPWIGSTFLNRLKQVDENEYFERPIKDLHSVAEIISHLTLWRSEAILKIRTGEGSCTDDCEENWLTNDKLKVVGWKKIKSSYDKTLSDLIELLHSKNDDFLAEQYYDTDFKGLYTYNWLLNGMIQHDAYHLGQIGIVIKYLNMK
ncbi:DinB family protein [Muricauda sp. JGD-17]|uniref:DinB family protein n=1 Tax=Flagellimonas ochracea TaxID=2696472 RepID=A0A964WWB9_9FLAO|nr:DinB family protein [Allomuricauda ochracea]NAY90444.1 DinB family protein [Allomuricauda ochracea]